MSNVLYCIRRRVSGKEGGEWLGGNTYRVSHFRVGGCSSLLHLQTAGPACLRGVCRAKLPLLRGWTDDEAAANARLIAAAPEMYKILSTNASILDTLIHEYELFDDPDISWLNDHLDATEKLLARIDGEEVQA